MKFTAYRFVCFILCISIFLSLSLFSNAESVEVPTDSIEINAHSYSYISGLSSYVYDLQPDKIYSVTSDSPSALGYGGLSFTLENSSVIAFGATYILEFVVAIPQGSISFLEGSIIGQIASMTQLTDIVIGSNCIITSNFDRTKYPNLFSSSALNYSSEAYLVTLSIDTDISDQVLGIVFDFDISSKNWNDFSIGYSYLSLYTSETDFIHSVLINIQNLLYTISSNMTSGFNSVTSVLNSFKTSVSNGFNSVLSSLSSIRTDMNNGFSELGDKLDNINQSISDGFQNELDKAEGDLSNSNDKIEQDSNSIENEKSDLDAGLGQYFDKFESDGLAQDKFLEDFNIGNVQEVSTFIYEALNEYVNGIQWVGSFFSLVLSFEPFAYLMYVIVFFNLLLLLLNNSSSSIGRMFRGERNHEAAIQRAEQRGVERERKRAFIQEKRENRRSMFDHYGF